MFERICVPYKFNANEEFVINRYYRSYTDWSNPHLDGVKSDLKSYLRIQQENECCYCRQTLGYDYRQVDIEHIVDKKGHDKFGFEPKNLALSCPACNSCKTNLEILVDPSVSEYPVNSDSFLIVHPYYDNYSEHIEINYPVFTAKTPKGSKTIKCCQLERLINVENRQKETMLKIPIIKSVIQNYTINECEQDIFDALIDIIREGASEKD